MNNATATKTVTCHKCLGRGIFEAFLHINNGKCFTCGGTGKVESRQVARAKTLTAKPVAAVRYALRRVATSGDEDPGIIQINGINEPAELEAHANRLDQVRPDYATEWELLQSLNGASFEVVRKFSTLWGNVAKSRYAQGLQPVRNANRGWSWLRF